ncbi:MAG: hypothetical protein WKF77_10205 [Planctomycetaceae bacterium]
MNSAQDPKPIQPAETERIQFLLSRHLDVDLTMEESSDLTKRQTDFDRACLAAMTDLRRQLKALPVKPVPELLAASVHNAIRQPSTTVPANSSRNPRRGRIMRAFVAVSVTACAAALMLSLRSREIERSDDAGKTALASGGHAAGMAARDIPATVAAASDVAEPKTSVPESSARQDTIAQHEELRPFLENDDWRIVLLKVHSKDREEVMRIIKALLAKGGMDIRSVAGNDDHDARFGVLLTSIGVNDNAFIDSVITETDAQSADWNPQSVADSTSESLIRRMQESMKTPTHSELHFGQVYLTLPKSTETAAAASQPLSAQDNAVNGTSLPPAAAEKRTAPPTGVATVPPTRKTPVLVVFEFTDEAIDQI